MIYINFSILPPFRGNYQNDFICQALDNRL
jgi:hypothetical protein